MNKELLNKLKHQMEAHKSALDLHGRILAVGGCRAASVKRG